MNANAVIVGGGIGGCALAHLLARAGWKVIILEKNAAPIRIDRPEVLWPPTLRVLSTILPAEALSRAIVPVQGMRIFRSGNLLLSFDTPAHSTHPAVGVAFTDPNLTRQLLIESDAFEVRRGVTIGGLLHENGRVVGVRSRQVEGGAEADLRADWVIGDDGGRSAVRAACGIPCDVQPLPADLLCFGFDWPVDFSPGVGHMFLNERWKDSGIFAMGSVPFPGGRGAAIIPIRPQTLQNPAQAAREFSLFLEKNPPASKVLGDRRFPDDLARFHPVYGHAERYGLPGAFLMGDAAHPVTPAGGQGANLSVNDAAALARILLERCPDPLQEYERERRPAAERSLRLSRGASRVMSMPDALLSRALVATLRIVGLYPRLFSPLLRTTSTAFVTENEPSKKECSTFPDRQN